MTKGEMAERFVEHVVPIVNGDIWMIRLCLWLRPRLLCRLCIPFNDFISC